MMDQIGQYILRLTAAALICGAVTALSDKKGTLNAVIKLLAGMFLTVCMLSPLVQVRLDDLEEFMGDIQISADRIGTDGKKAAWQELAQRISNRTEAYILEKAESLGAQITVEVVLNGADIPVPTSVKISGQISPYGKQKLGSIIANDLGIPAEEQIWS